MSVFHSDLFRQQALIAGSWRDAADGTTLAVSNPSTGATLGQIPNMGRAEAQQAVDAAAAALPNWRAFTAAQRAALLKNWHRLILENKTALAQIMTAEQGKPLAEAEGEIAYAASFIEWFAEQGKRANGEIIPSPGADMPLSRVHWKPTILSVMPATAFSTAALPLMTDSSMSVSEARCAPQRCSRLSSMPRTLAPVFSLTTEAR